jgi:hypothetical protein
MLFISGVKIIFDREQIATRNFFHELCFYYDFIVLVKTLLKNNYFYYKKNIKQNVKIRKCVIILLRNRNKFFLTANKCSPSFY